MLRYLRRKMGNKWNIKKGNRKVGVLLEEMEREEVEEYSLKMIGKRYVTKEGMYGACERGNVEVLRWLDKEMGCEWSDDAMDVASEKGHLDVVKYLHDNKYNYNNKYNNKNNNKNKNKIYYKNKLFYYSPINFAAFFYFLTRMIKHYKYK